MDATSFQGPEGVVGSAPTQGEPWSRSPMVNAAYIRILLAGMVPLPLGCIIRRLLRPRIRIVRSFFRWLCDLVHTCARAEQRIRTSAAANTHHCTVIVAPNHLDTSGLRATILKNGHWGRANQQTGNSPRLLK